MRKVTKDVCKAFLNGKSKKIGNTYTDGISLFLHGNKIAWQTDEDIVITLAGWPTTTTKERLNGLLELAGINKGFYTDKKIVHFGDSPVDSTDIIYLSKNS